MTQAPHAGHAPGLAGALAPGATDGSGFQASGPSGDTALSPGCACACAPAGFATVRRMTENGSALRLEFWGDTVEEVRWFKVADQRSLE
ncbi:hypothetical protein, partial [Nonomuraea sp. NPDC050783]|uniref:hypothetical protein n=1 Tax=Nonomuraea sp. NPDC050783 TaxID=3154634 RepID=UPI00346773D9